MPIIFAYNLGCAWKRVFSLLWFFFRPKTDTVYERKIKSFRLKKQKQNGQADTASPTMRIRCVLYPIEHVERNRFAQSFLLALLEIRRKILLAHCLGIWFFCYCKQKTLFNLWKMAYQWKRWPTKQPQIEWYIDILSVDIWDIVNVANMKTMSTINNRIRWPNRWWYWKRNTNRSAKQTFLFTKQRKYSFLAVFVSGMT